MFWSSFLWSFLVSCDEDEGDIQKSNTFQNTLPVITSVELSPLSAYTNDVVVANISVIDQEQQEIFLNYTWYVSDLETGTSTIVQSGLNGTLSGEQYFDKGDLVFVDVTPNDGIEDGLSLQSSQLTIMNTPPVLSEITLTPSEALEGVDDLTCQLIGTDVDQDELIYSFRWIDPDGDVQQSEADLTEGITVLDGTKVSEGTWTCEGTISDGEDDGITLEEFVVVQRVERCQSLEFDGIDDVVEVLDSGKLSLGYQDFTIDVILYPYENCGIDYANQCTFVSHSEGEGDVNKWALSWSQNGHQEYFGHYMQIGGGQDRWLIQHQQDNFSRKWSHISYVRNGNIISLYIDGKEVYHEDYTAMIPNPSASLFIGGAEDNRWFSGKINAIRISSVARYDDDFVPFENWMVDEDTTALWNSFQSDGIAIYDASENGLDGIVQGAVLIGSCPEEDLDGDGTPSSEDCDDQDPNLNGHDTDGDGYSSCTGDCNVNDGTIFPFAGDSYGDGTDSDCDGTDICESGMLNGVYFSACAQPSTWQNALERCIDRGYNGLVTITSEEENNFIHELLPVHTIDNLGVFWVGLNDILTEGDFEWSSGVGNSFFNWIDSEDIENDVEDCTSIYSNVFVDYLQWNDQNCNTNYSYVCEQREWQ